MQHKHLQMIIHTAYSDESGHYNEWKQQWDTRDKLDVGFIDIIYNVSLFFKSNFI